MTGKPRWVNLTEKAGFRMHPHYEAMHLAAGLFIVRIVGGDSTQVELHESEIRELAKMAGFVVNGKKGSKV